MRWIAWGIWLVVCAACTRNDQGQVLSVCTVVCRCEGPPVPAIQDECVEECVGDVQQFQLAQACVDCVLGNADRCNALENTCESACQLGSPPPVVVDGGIGSGGGMPPGV